MLPESAGPTDMTESIGKTAMTKKGRLKMVSKQDEPEGPSPDPVELSGVSSGGGWGRQRNRNHRGGSSKQKETPFSGKSESLKHSV